jgi:hypothetical protein
MSNPTSNFGWQMPTSTDLVTDLPADFEVFGQAVDTSMADLKGGTTGQVLAKASGTDMDFTWTAIDPLVILDAKGDLITATAADTPARLAVGTNDQILTADSTTATGLKWATPGASGGMTLLATITASAATSMSFTSISQSYKHLFMTWEGVFSSVNDTAYWSIRFNNDSSVAYSFYGSIQTGVSSAIGTTEFGTTASNAPILGCANIVDAPYSNYGSMWIRDYTNTTLGTGVNWGTMATTNGTVARQSVHNGIYHGTQAISRIDFIRNSTQTVTGTIRLYGVS